jgi:2',3'-cyclic-nucleotide 2'-phosphodiesterase (5'-nucleotidase family)
MRWKTGAEIGFHNSGGIRANILTGPITKRDIFEVSPFRNTLVVFKLTGREIKDLLEHDVDKDWDRLQVSGMSYSYHSKSSKPLGQRIECITINGKILAKDGKLLHPDRAFTVVSNNYLVSQAEDKYFGFPVGENKDTGILINQVLISWLEKHELLDCKIEGRIIKIDNKPGLFTSRDCCSGEEVAHELYLYTSIGLQRSRCGEIGLPEGEELLIKK